MVDTAVGRTRLKTAVKHSIQTTCNNKRPVMTNRGENDAALVLERERERRRREEETRRREGERAYQHMLAGWERRERWAAGGGGIGDGVRVGLGDGLEGVCAWDRHQPQTQTLI